MAFGKRAPFKFRWFRHLFEGPHVRPDNSASFNAGVAFDVSVGAGLRVRGHIHALTVSVKLDAVISTSNAIFFVTPKIEGHPPV